jgi:hypothetical protein
MAIRERFAAEARDRLVSAILRKHPPIRRLEEILGPEPAPEEAGEVDAFLRARAYWQQPCPAPEDTCY